MTNVSTPITRIILVSLQDSAFFVCNILNTYSKDVQRQRYVNYLQLNLLCCVLFLSHVDSTKLILIHIRLLNVCPHLKAITFISDMFDISLNLVLISCDTYTDCQYTSIYLITHLL